MQLISFPYSLMYKTLLAAAIHRHIKQHSVRDPSDVTFERLPVQMNRFSVAKSMQIMKERKIELKSCLFDHDDNLNDIYLIVLTQPHKTGNQFCKFDNILYHCCKLFCTV